LFLDTLRELPPYPKVRQLSTIFKNKLEPLKVHLILKYLERDKSLEIDLDGNIIWTRGQEDKSNTFFEKAVFTQEFKEHIKERKIDLSSNEDSLQ